MRNCQLILFVVLIFCIALIPPSRTTTLTESSPHSAEQKMLGKETLSSFGHDFWQNLWDWLMQALQLKHNPLQELIGSVTDRLSIVQQVYATGPHTVTASGNAHIDTSQFVFGGASARFDGSNSYLSSPSSTDWQFGTSDFTIDFWVRFNAFPANLSSFCLYGQFQDGNNWLRLNFWNNSNTYGIQFQEFIGGSTTVAFGPNYSNQWVTGTWYHIALVRYGNSWTIYKNGASDSTMSSSGSINALSAPITIGAQNSGSYLNGWLDEFRISNGIARWTSNFTPPTSAYTSDSYTVLLLHMDGTNGSTTFTDSSGGTTPPPGTFSFNVKATATQIVVTLSYSWSGTGSPPVGSITVTGQGGSPVLSESSGTIYDRTSISVSGSTSTYFIIHRVAFTITAPGSAQVWTVSVSLSGVSNYNLSIEVS